MNLRFVSAVLLIFLVNPGLLSYSTTRAASSDPVFDQINSIVQMLSEVTGLPEKHPVGYGRMSKEQLRHFLNKRIKKTIKPAEIQADELSLKMFGLVPQNFNLRESTVDLLTEQAAAFYDYDAKKLFLLDGSSPEEQTTTLAHELAHALADQYFRLDKFMDDPSISDDENLARTAVVEGQATWLMMAYELKQAGRSPIPDAAMLHEAAESESSSASDYPVLKSSPLYIRQSLLFPYSQGLLFFDAVYRKMGKAAFEYVFAHPPIDTSQVIHPSCYFAHIAATTPALPTVELAHRKREVTNGDLGEFDHEILLEQYLGAASAKDLSPHLRGSEFEIIAVGKERLPVLQYVSEWDSHFHATTFFRDYKQVLQKKWKHCDAALSTADTFAGTGDDGLFVTHFSGDKVWSVEGLHNPDDWTRLKRSAQSELQ